MAWRPWIASAVMVSIALSTLHAEQVVPILPVSQWLVRAEASDRIHMAERDGVLAIEFDVVTNRKRRSGPVVNSESRFFIERRELLTLTAGSDRLLFEARTIQSATCSISIRPLICDASGERISYPAMEIQSILRTAKENGWKRWKTNPFYANEAGGGLFDAEGGDENRWPDGILKLIGFEVRIAWKGAEKSTSEMRLTGNLFLGALRAVGTTLTDEPGFFIDSLLLEKGRYRLAWEARAAFQAAPVMESQQIVDFDPLNESSRRQVAQVPLLPLHNSWLRYRLSAENGSVISEGELRNETLTSPKEQVVPQLVDVSRPPIIGQIRLNPTRLSRADSPGGIYSEKEPFQITARVFPIVGKKQEKLHLKWSITPYAFDSVLQHGKQEVSFNWWNSYSDLIIPLPREAERDAYRFRYALVDASDQVIDSGEYTVGIARKSISPRDTRIGVLPERHEIKSRPYFRTTFLQPEFDRPIDETHAVKNFDKMLSQSRQMTSHVTYTIEMAELEILPGVYDFALLDKIMDIAADRECGVTIRVAHGEKGSPFRWQPYTRPRNYDGTPLHGHSFYGSYSLTDIDHVNSWKRCFRALYDRYSRHRAFEGYYLMKPGGEWILPEEPWNAHIADYSWSARESFRDYLRNDLNLDIASLNLRWGKAYRNWNEVMPPKPTFEDGAKPDLRMEWIDFSRCKLKWNDSWSELMAREIRSYDLNRIIIVYVRLMEEDTERLAGLVDYQHNGGLHGFEAEGQLVEAWEKKRIGWITEPHYPHHWAWDRNGWVLDWSVYVMLAQAGAGGVNLHMYYYPLADGQSGWYPHRVALGSKKRGDSAFSLEAHYGGTFAYDRFELFKPIMRELYGMQLSGKRKQVAVIDDISTLLTKHRTTFRARTLDLCRGFDLLKADSIDFENYQQSHENDYRMVVLNPLNEVLAPETLDAIERMTRNGALLVMNAHSGVYSTEFANERDVLLKKLGIVPPAGTFSSNISSARGLPINGRAEKVKLPAVTFTAQREIDRQLNETQLDYLNWPYRWLPRFDSFGYYAKNPVIHGKILARFQDGGVAVTLHEVGKGQALVFWGTLELSGEVNRGVMAAAARMAGIENPRLGNPIEHMILADRVDLGRHYAVLYQEKYGKYQQKITHIPDGKWFVDDMVTGERLGVVDGARVRQSGLPLTFRCEQSPLKILRFIPMKEAEVSGWAGNYRSELGAN